MEVGEVPGIWKIGEEVGNSLEMKGLVRKGKKPGMHGRKQNVLVCLECLKWQEIRREK